jgi:2-oxoisovalerate dehydrogenase E1 component
MKRYDIKTTDTETLRKWYYLMSLGRALDEKAPSYLLQSLGWSYHAPYAGHDGIQLAIGQVFHRGEDYLFPYYRDMLTVLSAGMTAEEIILNGISKATAYVQPLRQAGVAYREHLLGDRDTRPARRRCRPCNGLLRP